MSCRYWRRSRPARSGEPGWLLEQLPDSPPEEGEPFSAVLRDLDEVLLPGITHWQHPGFFAYFATTGSEPGILAELLAATLNVTQILWRASPAATELELVTMDWLASCSGSRASGTATSRTRRRR